MDSEETYNVKFDMDVNIARLILDTAQWNSRAVPKDQIVGLLSPELIRDAANLVFFTMDLIRERRS